MAVGCFCFPTGSALDLNFSDINVASLDKELEEQDNNVGLASKDAYLIVCKNTLAV